MKRFFATLLISGSLLGGIAVIAQNSGAAARDELRLPRFEFTCQTTEIEFYDWIENEIWVGPTSSRTHFRRTLDGAIAALVTNPHWTIKTTTEVCDSKAMRRSRREALYFMIDDARSEGAGQTDFGSSLH